jgi:hypothetical protein
MQLMNRQTILAFSILITVFLTPFASPNAKEPVDFDKEIRPILSRACFACHGPDERQQKGELRLDMPNEHATSLLSPGKASASEIVARILSDDDEQRMPPPGSKKSLTKQEIAQLTSWIDDGATYRGHWAWEAPVRPELPPINNKLWPRNEIDFFIGAALDAVQMNPSEEADRETLIRRASLDLRGLPPSIREIDQFLADDSEAAYETMIDQFLSSPHYGERMAQDWLDMARYGDTNGYHADSDRDMWLYRDYVIDAFNQGMPYSQFVIENVAGDLLPNATQRTRIASGFNRNATFNEEGGADPDEFYVAYAIDRANTTGQVFLGMTFGCAQCHDHKYDPISQREYYQFYAFFNSVEGEIGAGGASGYHNKPLPPLLRVETDTYAAALKESQQRIADAESALATERERLLSDAAEIHRVMLAWVATRNGQTPPSAVLSDKADKSLVLWLAADDINGNGIVDSEEAFSPDDVVDQWHDKTSYQHHAKAIGAPQYVAESFGKRPTVKLDGTNDFLRTERGGERLVDDFTMVITLQHDKLDNHQMMLMWGLEENGKRRALWKIAGGNQVGFNGYNADVSGAKPLVNDRPQIAVIAKSGGTIKLYLDGLAAGEGTPDLKPFLPPAENPITIGANNAGNERTSAEFAEIMLFNRVLSDVEREGVVAQLARKYDVQAKGKSLPEAIAAIVQLPVDSWTVAQSNEVTRFFSEDVYLPNQGSLRALASALDARRKETTDIQNGVPTTMVMVQKKESNPAFILMRGDFQNPTERVEPDVPAIFPRLPSDQPRDRLGLAHWLADPQHPLVARVAVNRFWKQIYGTGLSKTLGDLGTQGERPTHPRLLDWLAVEFIESGWDTKHIQKLLVMSSTYRQSSRHAANDEHLDPDNRLLSRATRFRLSAEGIRDNALAVSGLLAKRVGGPSVRPYQPAGYYADKVGRGWEQSKGEDLYRRGLYTYWRRTTVYPTFQIFDAPSREFCTVDRPRTNTPLQALVLLNDPTYVEAARVFGEKILLQADKSMDARINFAFRSAIGREPTAAEREVGTEIIGEQVEQYSRDTVAAKKLVEQGESPPNKTLDVAQHAAWTAFAAILLNLDETVTRE